MDLRYLEVPLGALDTASDPTSLPPGTLTIADNCSADTPGVYEKRNGYTALSMTSGPASIMRLAKLRDELVASSGTELYGFGSAANAWHDIGSIPEAQTSEATVILNESADITVGTVAVAAGVRVEAWIASGGVIYLQAISIADGSKVYYNGLVAIGTVYQRIRAAAAGNQVLVVYSSPASQKINVVRFDCSTLTISADTAYKSGANVDPTLAQFDVCPLNATDVLIAYKTTTPNVQVERFNVSTLTTSAGPTAVSTETVDRCLAIQGTTGEFGAILYHSTASGGMRAACFNVSTTAQTVAPFNVEAVTSPLSSNCGLVRVDATHIMAVWDRDASGIVKQYVQWRSFSSAGATTAIRGPLFNFSLVSKPWTYGGNYYVNVWTKAALQQTFFTVKLKESFALTIGSSEPVATHAYRTANSAAATIAQLSDVAQLSSGVFSFVGVVAYKFLSTSTPRAGLKLFSSDFASPTRLWPVEAMNTLHFSNGVGAFYDGLAVIETNFLQYPELTQATPGAVGSGGMDNGTYSYVAIFEYSDTQGNTHRSTTSIPVTAVTTAGAGLGKVTLTIDQLGLTRIAANGAARTSAGGVISLFRTKRQEDGSSVYFFVGSSLFIGLSGSNVTIVDQAHDSTIGSNRVLYTTGGVLEREPPPPSLQFLVHKNRIWGISSADRKVLFYSGELGPGEAPWFSSLQQVRVDAGGDITAIASMDDKLIVFKSDRIFKIYGSGMNALGQNNDLSQPLPVNTDAGAIDPRSVVQMSDGTMYRNRKGIQILLRGEESGYIGAPVQTYVDAAANVTAAVMLADAREVRFELDTGKKAVLNYGTKRWTTHSNYQGSSAVDAIVVGGRYYWATAAGAVYQEKGPLDSARYLDPSSTYAPMRIQLAWFAPAGKQGLARVRKMLLLAELLDPHDLTITTAVNYDEVTPPLVSLLTDATLATLPREQVRVSLKSEKVQSVRVDIVDALSSGTNSGQGYKLRGIGFMAGVKKGAFDKRMVNAAKV